MHGSAGVTTRGQSQNLMLSKFMHPSEHIRNKFPNPVAGHCLEGCIVVEQEVKHVTKRDQLCVVVQHDGFKADNEHIELHAVK